MNDNDLANFKIRLDDDSPDEILNDEIKELEEPVKKPSNIKIFLLFFMFLIVLAAGLAAVYLDIRKRVTTNINAGTSVISNVSKEVSANLVAIADRQREFEIVMNENISSLKTSVSELNKQIKNIEGLAKSLQTSKSDKTDVSTMVDEVENKISTIQSSIEPLPAQIKTLSDEVKGEVAGVMKNIEVQKEKLDVIQKDMSHLNKEKLDKTVYEKDIQNNKDRYTNTLGKVKKEIEFIRYKIKVIEERLPAPLKGSEPPSSLIPGEMEKGISEQTIQ